MVFLALLAEMALERGELSRAAELASHAIEREADLSTSRVAGPYYVWGTVLLERHELFGAISALELAIERADNLGSPWCRVLARVSLANALRGRGDVERARWTIRDAGRQDGEMPPLLRQRIIETKAWFALLDSDDVRAQGAIAQLDEPTRSRMQAHLKAAAGDVHGVLSALDSVSLTATFDRIDGLLLRARCAEDPEARLRLTREALSAAEPDAYVRPFLNRGRWLSPVLTRLAATSPTTHATRLVRVVQEAAAPASSAPGVHGLTPREREVLSYLGTRLSIGDIARKLFISRNTAKSHVRSIYQKLGVRSRLEADTWQRQLMP